MIITIAGVPGSGKTSVAKILAEKLGMPFYSMGTLRGKMAMERGMTIDEWNAVGEKDAITDTSVDEYQRALGKKEDGFIVEGRLSWHFIPHSFKIFLDCEPMEAARRVYHARQHDRSDEPLYASIEQAREQLDKRVASDVLRYQTHYGVDYRDPKHYNLVMDTTRNSGPEETVEQIMKILKLENSKTLV